MYNIVFYDIETTGTNIYYDRMIELAAYRENTNTYYHKLIKTDYPISEEASKINGITYELIKNKKYFNDLVSDFEDFLEFNNPFNITYLISHNNNNFDKLILMNEYKRINRKLPNIIFIDSLPISRYLLPDLDNHKLNNIMDYYKITMNNHHEALDDVNSLYKIYQQFRKIKNDKQLFHISKNFIIKKMPFGKYKNEFIKDIPKDYVNWLKNNILNDSKNKDLINGFKKYNQYY